MSEFAGQKTIEVQPFNATAVRVARSHKTNRVYLLVKGLPPIAFDIAAARRLIPGIDREIRALEAMAAEPEGSA